MPNDAFFEGFREWSDRKLALLQNYIGKPFTEILGRRPAGVYCVDGFAGRGEYGDGRTGSSVLTARAAQQFEEQGNYRLRCINVERNAGHFRNLDAVTRAIAPGLVTNLQGKFETKLPAIIAQVESAPTLFFLDPYGIRGIEWETLEPIMRRRDTTEILIRLHTPYLHRLSGFVGSSGRSAGANIARLTRTIGTEGWMAIASTEQEAFVNGVVDLYCQQLKKSFNFVGAYPVREIETERLKYHMVFCTRHHRGAIIMSDIVYKTDEAFLDRQRENALRRGVQLQMLDSVVLPHEEADVLYEQKLNELMRRIGELVSSQPQGITYARIKASLVEEFFGLVSDHYYRQAVKRLKSQSLVRGDGRERITDGSLLLPR